MRHPDQVRTFDAEAVKGRTQPGHLGHDRIARRERPVLESVLNREALHIYDAMGPRKDCRYVTPPVGAEESSSKENHRVPAPENPCLRTQLCGWTLRSGGDHAGGQCGTGDSRDYPMAHEANDSARGDTRRILGVQLQANTATLDLR